MMMKPLAALLLLAALQDGLPPHPGYETRAVHDPNGIGKFYLGREIALVMGHQAAGWLERPEREQEEAPTKLVEGLELKPGMVVADVGVGTGYFAFRMAPKVGEAGKVLGVDIQPEMLAKLKARAAELGVKNVEGVLGAEQDPKLPAGQVDLVLMVDVYHEFSHPYEMMTAIRKALKPGGRVALVEYRKEDPAVPIKEVHKMAEAQARREMQAVGLEWIKTVGTLPRQHLMLFEKRGKD
jgi:cyclopropane fatty-acyl-phospholipid synthase-like methyltransferase